MTIFQSIEHDERCVRVQSKVALVWLIYQRFLFDTLQPTIGTNPISVSAPGRGGDSFQLDMATSAVAQGKVGHVTPLSFTGPPFYVVIRATVQYSAKGVTSFLGYFKTLSIGLALRIKPTTSRSADKSSTDLASPAAVCIFIVRLSN